MIHVGNGASYEVVDKWSVVPSLLVDLWILFLEQLIQKVQVFLEQQNKCTEFISWLFCWQIIKVNNGLKRCYATHDKDDFILGCTFLPPGYIATHTQLLYLVLGSPIVACFLCCCCLLHCLLFAFQQQDHQLAKLCSTYWGCYLCSKPSNQLCLIEMWHAKSIILYRCCEPTVHGHPHGNLTMYFTEVSQQNINT